MFNGPHCLCIVSLTEWRLAAPQEPFSETINSDRTPSSGPSLAPLSFLDALPIFINHQWLDMQYVLGQLCIYRTMWLNYAHICRLNAPDQLSKLNMFADVCSRFTAQASVSNISPTVSGLICVSVTFKLLCYGTVRDILKCKLGIFGRGLFVVCLNNILFHCEANDPLVRRVSIRQLWKATVLSYSKAILSKITVRSHWNDVKSHLKSISQWIFECYNSQLLTYSFPETLFTWRDISENVFFLFICTFMASFIHTGNSHSGKDFQKFRLNRFLFYLLFFMCGGISEQAFSLFCVNRNWPSDGFFFLSSSVCLFLFCAYSALFRVSQLLGKSQWKHTFYINGLASGPIE